MKGNMYETGAGRKGSLITESKKQRTDLLGTKDKSRNHSFCLDSLTLSTVLPQSLTTLYFEP